MLAAQGTDVYAPRLPAVKVMLLAGSKRPCPLRDTTWLYVSDAVQSLSGTRPIWNCDVVHAGVATSLDVKPSDVKHILGEAICERPPPPPEHRPRTYATPA